MALLPNMPRLDGSDAEVLANIRWYLIQLQPALQQINRELVDLIQKNNSKEGDNG